MGSDTAAILTRTTTDDVNREAAERVLGFAAEQLGISPEAIRKIETDLIDLQTDTTSAERLFRELLSSSIRLIYVGDLSLNFKTSADGNTVLAFLERAGYQIFRAPGTDSALRDQQEARKSVAIIIGLEHGYRQARLQAARERNAKAGGKHGGNPPYGALSGEAVILERIRRDHAAGLGHTEIASRLNAEVITPRKGQRWHPAVIANILGVRRDAKRRASVRLAKDRN